AAIAVMRPPQVNLGSTFALPPAGSVTTDDAGWSPGSPKRERVSLTGLTFSTDVTSFERSDLPLAPTAHHPTAASTVMGCMPYAMGTKFYVLDLLGLADPFTSRLETPHLTTLLPYAGHEKQLPRPWIAARLLPEGAPVRPVQLPGGGIYDLAPHAFGPAFDHEIADARAGWDCPAIRRLRESYTSKLTVGRFFSTLVDSSPNTRFRL